jgi:hypothetical protein
MRLSLRATIFGSSYRSKKHHQTKQPQEYTLCFCDGVDAPVKTGGSNIGSLAAPYV